MRITRSAASYGGVNSGKKRSGRRRDVSAIELSKYRGGKYAVGNFQNSVGVIRIIDRTNNTPPRRKRIDSEGKNSGLYRVNTVSLQAERYARTQTMERDTANPESSLGV